MTTRHDLSFSAALAVGFLALAACGGSPSEEADPSDDAPDAGADEGSGGRGGAAGGREGSTAGGSSGTGGGKTPDGSETPGPDAGGSTPVPVDPSAANVALYGVFEASFEQQGAAKNPYREISGDVMFTRPDGSALAMPMFWDGEKVWRVRFSPDQPGSWRWSSMSADPGLGGRSGSFSVEGKGLRGGVRTMASRPHHFEYQNGEPMWWMGDTEWTLFVDLPEKKHDRAAVFAYVDDRADAGFNVIHATAYRLESNAGGTGFSDLASENLNHKYWREVDERLRYVNGAGITMGVNLAWGTDRWSAFPSDEARVRFARYITSRYAAYNVYFIVAGEYDEALTAAQVRKLGEAVSKADPHRRLVAVHATGNVDTFAKDAWMSFGDYAQDRTDRHMSALAARTLSKPVINAEHAYYRKDDGTNAVSDLDLTRLWHWEISMAGAYWMTGFGSTYRGGTRDSSGFNADPAEGAWKQQATHMRKLFSTLPFWLLEPSDELVTASGTRFALAQAGKLFVVYVAGVKGSAMLNAKGTSASDMLSVKRFDPRTGESIELPSAKGGTVTLTVPDAKDWVFVVGGGAGGG